MCGFLCIINPNGISIPLDTISLSAAVLSHRGPDSNNTYISQDKVFAAVHYRLAIIGDSTTADQPITDGVSTLVFNGEIYNYKDLCLGSSYRSDTKALFHHLVCGQVELNEEIDGMYSIVFYNSKAKTITISRDYAGEKPLYFSYLNQHLIIASEASAIIRLGKLNGSPYSLSRHGVASYLLGGAPHSEETVVSGIFEFPRNTTVVHPVERFNTIKNAIKELKRQRDSSELARINQYRVGRDHQSNEIKKIFETAVTSRLQSDVPVACLLSGGIDSLAIAAVLKKKGAKINYYTLASNHNQAEVDIAMQVAKENRLDHKVIKFEQPNQEFIQEILCQLDLPNGDSSLLNVYSVIKAIAPYNKVCLSGDGGDEMFLGYQHYRWFSSFNNLNCLIGKNRIAKHLSDSIDRCGRQKLSSSVASAIGLQYAARKFYSRYCTPEQVNRLMNSVEGTEQNESRDRAYKYYLEMFGCDDKRLMSAVGFADFNTTMRELILFKTDRGSMLNSVELRAPILTKELARFAFSLEDCVKLSNEKTKIPLRNIVGDEFGYSICNLRKTGFGVDFSQLLTYFTKALESNIDKVDQVGLDREEVRKILKPTRVVNNSKRIYALYSLVVWKVWGGGRDVLGVLM
jgi:asparagine synthase (glutamine-hydrolysing)